MINSALAASASAGQDPSFFATSSFWAAVAFIIVVAAAARPVGRGIAGALDVRSNRIRDQIEEAQRLREEAQQMLASYQRKQRDAAKEAEEIVSAAEAEAKRLAEAEQAQLEHSLKRREQQAKDRLNQAEQDAVNEVRSKAVEIAVQAARDVIAEQITAQKQNALIDKAIDELPSRLHH